MARVNYPNKTTWRQRTMDAVWFCGQLGEGFKGLPWPFRWAIATLTIAGVTKFVGYPVALEVAHQVTQASGP